MEHVLDEIATGAFAREWQAEVAAGSRHLAALLAAGASDPIEAARRSAVGEEKGQTTEAGG